MRKKIPELSFRRLGDYDAQTQAPLLTLQYLPVIALENLQINSGSLMAALISSAVPMWLWVVGALEALFLVGAEILPSAHRQFCANCW
jgi:hypothetical protein